MALDDANLYAPFGRSLQDLRSQVVQAHPDIRNLQADFLTLQQYFQTTLLPTEYPNLADSAESKLVSYHAEISKELRLLGMDIMFLQSARQTMTIQQRQAQIRDRLDRLRDYCDRIVEGLETL
ncbi:MAG: heterocyst frequency control protein PatD [Synechococcales cyanobacterium T60_A2020_003]|nr:heterocyst frequency control protein PatD [Synechococcales cyanobacterium T60_A2020_003]